MITGEHVKRYYATYTAWLNSGSDSNSKFLTERPTQILSEFDPVQKPSHYNQGEIECIDAIAVAIKDLKGIEAACTSNAIKYLWRWKLKNGVEDLKKAKWYIDHLIKTVEK